MISLLNISCARPQYLSLRFPDKEEVLASVIVIVPVFRDAKSFAKHRNLPNRFKHHVAVCGTTVGNLLTGEALPAKADLLCRTAHLLCQVQIIIKSRDTIAKAKLSLISNCSTVFFFRFNLSPDTFVRKK